MYVTYVVRPGDAPEGRGPKFRPFWDSLMNYNLRGGFVLQLLGYFFTLTSVLIGGNVLQMFGLLSGEHRALKNAPIALAMIGALLYTAGAVWIQNFRNIADDDASIKQSRGFRAGLKGLHHASLLDILSWAFTAILLFSYLSYFEDDWTTKRVGSGSVAIFAAVARSFHGLASILYSVSFFMVENFHTEGTAEFWGWALCILYKVAGCTELLCLFLGCGFWQRAADVCFTVVSVIALLASLLWSLSFEPVLQRSDVKMTQSAMGNEIYKSRNAMAYYGPPGGVEMVNNS